MSAVGDARKRRTEAEQSRALADTIAATLAEHESVEGGCTCGGDCGWTHGDFLAHVATVLAEQEAQRRKVSLDAQAQWYGKPARGGAHL